MDSPLVIPVFIPHWGCPHRCSFCNQSTITGRSDGPTTEPEVEKTVDHYLKYRGKRSRVELAFFGGNFLGMAPRKITKLLDRVTPYIEKGMIHGLRCSTRPDTISRQSLDLIRGYDFSLIELGVQSMDDQVLEQAMRGHTRADILSALGLLKAYGVPAGVQVMVGLGGETGASLVQGALELAALQPATARIYPLMVLAGSGLARQYEKGQYAPLTLDRAVDLTKRVYQIFTGAGTRVIRMGLQASEMMEDDTILLAGPWHPAFGHLVLSSIMLDKAVNRIQALMAKNRGSHPEHDLILTIHPRTESRLRGDKNGNLSQLTAQFPDLRFFIQACDRVRPEDVEVSLN